MTQLQLQSKTIHQYYTDRGIDGNLAAEQAQDEYMEYRFEGGRLSIDQWFAEVINGRHDEQAYCSYIKREAQEKMEKLTAYCNAVLEKANRDY